MTAAGVLGVDVGGTFTDLVFVGEDGTRPVIRKVPSTTDDQSRGVVDAVREAGLRLESVDAVVHGTTVGTNALLERKGARCGLITTAGFRDILELRRRDRPCLYGLHGSFEPLIPRERRLEVRERTGFDGAVRVAVDGDDVDAAARQLLDDGVDVVVVSFLHSYANSANERAAAAAVSRARPGVRVVAGSDVVREWREFERTSTAVASAYIQPTIDAYLAALADRLRGNGFGSDVLVIQSNGGVMASATAAAAPVNTVLSGPAAGVIAAVRYGEATGRSKLISLDIGGTSCDVAVVDGGAPALKDQTELEFGIPLRVPMLDITTIGAGGGSVAWIDRGGVLQVGPRSAGAFPGPACYGRGGTEPTVTDANLVLGWLGEGQTLGGRTGPVLMREPAVRAIDERVARPLGLRVEAAAEAILRVVNARMVEQLRTVSVQRGHDPREFSLVAFGGAGPLHAAALVREAGLSEALVVPFPGITSALGCVLADVRHDFVHTVNERIDELDLRRVEAILDEDDARGRSLVAAERIPIAGERVVHHAEMQYEGQTHTTPVELGPRELETPAALRAAFEAAYARAYGASLAHRDVRLVNLRTTFVGVRPRVDLRAFDDAAGGAPRDAIVASRAVYQDGREHECPVYARARLARGAAVDGPAIVEQGDSTTAIPHGMRGVVDDLGDIVVSRR